MKKLYDGNVLLMTALVDTLVRDVVEFNASSGDTTSSVGIAQVAGLAGEEISVDVVGVYEFDGANADAIAVGDDLYWDGTEVTTTATTNTYVGKSWSAKGAVADGKVAVKIG